MIACITRQPSDWQDPLKHPHKRQRGHFQDLLFLQLPCVFKHNFVPASWQLIKQKPLGAYIAYLPAEMVTYLWHSQIAGCLLFSFAVSCLPNAYQSYKKVTVSVSPSPAPCSPPTVFSPSHICLRSNGLVFDPQRQDAIWLGLVPASHR